MTLEQCVKLKEMGFPQYCKQYIYDPVNEKSEHYANPTAEEALEWVKSKLDNKIVITLNKRIVITY